MLGAGVPEAAVDEHRQTNGREEDVRFTPQSRDGSAVLVEAQADPMKPGTDRDLKCGVARSVVLLHRHPVSFTHQVADGLHSAMIKAVRPAGATAAPHGGA